MTDYLLLIPTFNRGDLLIQALRKMEAELLKTDSSCKAIIWNDGSHRTLDEYSKIDTQFKEKRFQVLQRRYRINRGRRGFWKTLSELMALAKAEKFRWAIMMPDDVLPCHNFFERVTKRFLELQAEDHIKRVVAMNLICTLLRNWGRGRFVDNVFIAERAFFEAIGWVLKPATGRWRDNPRMGSGTGNQMTQILANHRQYRIAPNQDCSWFRPLEVPSVMFQHDSRPLVWWRDNYVGEE